MLTAEQLAQAVMCTPVRAAQWAGPLRRAMAAHGIDTPRRVAHFLGQIGHESGGLARVSENLNYSAPRLLEIFPRYFTREQAAACARQPERIANRVYANRMGNGEEASGDGWRYRGRGLMQHTGRNNYRRMAALLGLPLLEHPGLLGEPEHAAAAAAAYWRDERLNHWADQRDILALSRKINLGSANSRATPHGLQDRIARTRRALDILETR